MKHLVTWIIFLLIYTPETFSQTGGNQQDAFDSTFYHIYMHTASEDVRLALKAADSLYQTSVSDIHKIRSLMLIGDMYHRMANRDSSIFYAIEAEKIAVKANIYDWQARIYGVLSTQYRETGLLSEGKKYLEKGLKAIDKVDDVNRSKLYKGQCYQEMGFYALEEEHLQEAIQSFKWAATFFNDLPESPTVNFALTQNEERLGLCYLERGIVDSANCHYLNALALGTSTSDAETPLHGFIYSGLGRVYTLQGAYHEANVYLEKALSTAETTGFPHLKISVYKSLALYHKATNNNEDYMHYSEKHIEAVRDNASKHSRYADNVLVGIQQKLVEMTASHKIMSSVASVLILLGGMGMGIYIWQQKRNYRRFKELIHRLRKEGQAAGKPAPVMVDSRDKELMPEDKKQELLKKLERFESSLQFTDKNISIAVLAGKMKTNTKYLSHIINNFRHKDFNTYINDLRINYIIAKMEEDSRYLNYKISYLAEECGFSTHSQFTTIFRNVTGLAPSTFMTYLKKTNKDKKPVMVD
ncbi:helix-turn-helix domain-containing protein [Parapedobacter tibetensis]|uniref:helix-turn-helix domain-containing protein n=1 Tax=Parapedobacter tibetensis TaxID=2972951 RepID=UPI00214D1C25|nr:helix-turn-helix domain-containing protein [Parapedobacter tibetensis]